MYKEFTCSIVTGWGCRVTGCLGTCLPFGLRARVVPRLPTPHAVPTSQAGEQKSSEVMPRGPPTGQAAAFMDFGGTCARAEMWCGLSGEATFSFLPPCLKGLMGV